MKVDASADVVLQLRGPPAPSFCARLSKVSNFRVSAMPRHAGGDCERCEVFANAQRVIHRKRWMILLLWIDFLLPAGDRYNINFTRKRSKKLR